MIEMKCRVWLEEIEIMEYSDKLSSFFKDYEGTNILIMQYIGRKDINSVEIYDGDVVIVTHPHDTTGDFTGTCGQVFYDAAECAWYHVGHNGRPPKRMWEFCEVVGNIYQNPELLE